MEGAFPPQRPTLYAEATLKLKTNRNYSVYERGFSFPTPRSLRYLRFTGNMIVRGGLGTLQFFGHLKRALELLISIRMSPFVTL